MTDIEGDERAEPGGEMDTGRVLALSDGVFAIAATLLVLDLRLPEGLAPKELPHQLHELLPVFGGYALSYVLIGLLWLGHHRLFRSFTKISTRVARLNLLFLGSVSVLPFVTSLLSRYDEPIAVQLYAGTIAVIFLLEAAMGLVSQQRGHADRVTGFPLTLRTLAMAAIFVSSIPLAQIPEHGPAVAKYSWLALIPVRWTVNLMIRRRRRDAGRGAGGSAIVEP
jgi:TMEM175 potassium channel family protein